MMPQQQRDRPPAFGRQLQPPGRGHWHTLYLGNDRAQPAMPQAFLSQCQRLGIVGGFGIEDALWFKSRLHQAGGEQVAAAHDPQNVAPTARRDPGQKQAGGGEVARLDAGGGDVMQRVESQPAGRQPCIHPLHPEGQSGPAAGHIPLTGRERSL